MLRAEGEVVVAKLRSVVRVMLCVNRNASGIRTLGLDWDWVRVRRFLFGAADTREMTKQKAEKCALCPPFTICETESQNDTSTGLKITSGGVHLKQTTSDLLVLFMQIFSCSCVVRCGLGEKSIAKE